MPNTLTTPAADVQPAVRIGSQYGYRLDGDQVALNAELTVLRDEALQADWALQLWACDASYSGGELRGCKIAEAPLALTPVSPLLEVSAPAAPPAGTAEYTMVLALVSGSPDGFETLHDAVNFSTRQVFLQPRLCGPVRWDAAQQQVQIAAIDNPRPADNISGTLSLELWALDAPYQGGAFSGLQLAALELGQLAGGAQWTAPALTVNDPQPAAAMTLMLREWTANGYITRDFYNFESVSVPTPLAAATEPATETTTEPATEATTDDGRVSVNTASPDELRAVKGLSQKVADGIVAGRPHDNLDDLLKVKGIGAKLLEKVRAFLKI